MASHAEFDREPLYLQVYFLLLERITSGELLPVPRTHGLGVMMELEVANGTTEFQPGVQARGGEVGARAWSVRCA
ncbi:MAG: hypothetical protein K8F92_10475, partial [Hyphomicrobium sp.]|uniref:hypothetical protein n=2 Tax=Hyphomicrobium sp. TaxID=82 RepID=UPI0025B84A23